MSGGAPGRIAMSVRGSQGSRIEFNERPRIRVLRRGEDPRGRAVFDHLAGIHDIDPVADRPDHGEVVRNENEATP